MSAAERAYAAADSWRALAEAAQDALADADRTARSLTANNSGCAVDAFADAWSAQADPARGGPLPRLVRECGRLVERCEQYAARLASAS